MNAVALDPHTELEMLRAEITKRDAEIRKRDAQIRDRDAEIAKHETVLGKRDREIRLQAARIEQLAQVIAKFQRMQFAARSEKFDPTQQALFDDAFGADLGATQAELDVLRTTPRERAQPKRQPLPPELPRVEERIEPASCTCSACGGELHCIGEEVSEKLDVKPVEFFVRKIIRAKLACRGCETIHTPPALPALIERGIAAPGLLAHVLIGKYADHLPLYRQSDMLARSGVTLPVSTLSEWVGATGFALQPLVDALRSELHRRSVLHADETPVQLLTPGKGKTQTAYLFAYRRGEIDEPPIIVYDFAENRSGSNARRFLADYGGALVVDDYAGYKSLFQSTPMREVGCWAHARRKFFELHEANKSGKRPANPPSIA